MDISYSHVLGEVCVITHLCVCVCVFYSFPLFQEPFGTRRKGSITVSAETSSRKANIMYSITSLCS